MHRPCLFLFGHKCSTGVDQSIMWWSLSGLSVHHLSARYQLILSSVTIGNRDPFPTLRWRSFQFNNCVLLDRPPAWSWHQDSSSSLAYWSRANVLVDARINHCWLLWLLQAWTGRKFYWRGRGSNGSSAGWSWRLSRESSGFRVLGEGWGFGSRVWRGHWVVLFDQYLLLHLE